VQDSWPARVEETLRLLRSAGIRAYVVGGAVRDRLLGRDTRDFDLLIEVPLEIAHRALPEASLIGAHTPVLILPARGEHPRIEITGLRSGSRGLEEDLGRRDFTLNSMAFDPVAGVIRDPFGGREHLRDRRLIAVDPRRGFSEDPARILRGIRLAEELSLTVEPRTELAMSRDAWRLARVPGERLREECFRLLQLPTPSGSLEQLRSLGALAVALPEVVRTVGVGQNRFHSDDVYRHTLRVTDEVNPEPLLRLAALLHDAAKPETKCFRKSREDFSFHRHELLATRHIARVALRLRLSRQEEATVERLVRHHLLFPRRLKTDRAIRRLVARVGEDILAGLLELRRADLASRNPHGRLPSGWEELVRRIEAVRGEYRRRGDRRLALSGRDVQEVLGIPEGPEVGRWLRRARRRVLDRPEENERERMIAWLRRSAAREEGGCTRH
jgi:tRNA nucleotidyltransferase (CCA-adding enzyme)